MIANAVQIELQELLNQHKSLTVDGKQAVVRNGYLPERTVQTGIGEISVKVPKVRNRSRQGIKFNCSEDSYRGILIGAQKQKGFTNL